MTQIVSINDIKKIVSVLKKGGVIAYPTETAYGLGADATNSKAVAKIFKLKKRKSKPVLVLVHNEKMVHKHFKLNKVAEKLMKKLLPGPLTLVCDKKNLPDIIGKDSHGFRISSNNFVKKLVKAFGKPIISTSANISGKPTLYRIDDVKKQFYGNLDIIVDGGDLKKRKLSTVFDTRKLEVIRKGVVDQKKIFKNITKVLCGGCFNKSHKGHEYFLKKAKSYGDYLVVLISNDHRNKRKYGKGFVSAATRKKNIEKFGIADKVLIGNKGSMFKILDKEKPNIVVLGHDQKQIPKNIVSKYKLKVVRIDRLRV